MASAAALAIALAALGWSQTPPDTGMVARNAGGVRLRVEGQQIFRPEVYRALLGAQLGSTTATRAEQRIREFLHRAGYDLAQVRVTRRDGELHLWVDEGRLERIWFPGQRGLGALRLQLALDLPGEIFHRPSLERQLENLSRRSQVEVLGYELRPTRSVNHRGVQLRDLGQIGGLEVAPKAGKYELWIFTDEEDLPPGLHFDAAGRAPDGLVLSAELRNRGWWLRESRWSIRAGAGLRIEELVQGTTLGPISLANASAEWLSPPLLGSPIRLAGWASVNWVRRARPDLAIAAYERLQIEPQLGLRYLVAPDLSVTLGVGLSRRWLSTSAVVPEELRLVDPLAPFLSGRADLRLGAEQRLDRRHRFGAELRQIFGQAPKLAWRGEYGTSFGFGYDDLVLAATGGGVLGRPTLDDEPRFSDHLFGLYGDEITCDTTAAWAIEYRVSLVRELYKVGAIGLGGLCLPPKVDPAREVVGAAGIGMSFHALLLDTFRLGARFLLGLATTGVIDDALGIELSQTF